MPKSAVAEVRVATPDDRAVTVEVAERHRGRAAGRHGDRRDVRVVDGARGRRGRRSRTHRPRGWRPRPRCRDPPSYHTTVVLPWASASMSPRVLRSPGPTRRRRPEGRAARGPGRGAQVPAAPGPPSRQSTVVVPRESVNTRAESATTPSVESGTGVEYAAAPAGRVATRMRSSVPAKSSHAAVAEPSGPTATEALMPSPVGSDTATTEVHPAPDAVGTASSPAPTSRTVSRVVGVRTCGSPVAVRGRQVS